MSNNLHSANEQAIQNGLSVLHAQLACDRAVMAQLLSRIHQEKMPAAVMIAGPQGIGKSLSAQALAAYWLAYGQKTEAEKNDSFAQSYNQELRLLSQDSHPDGRSINAIPTAAQSADMAQISVAQIRDLLTFLRRTPTRGAHKVAVINKAEQMNLQAANALLKALEEPQPRSCIILTSANPAALLPTIRSRLSVFHAKPLDDEQMKAAIANKSWPLNPALLALAQGRLFVYQQLSEALPQKLIPELESWRISQAHFPDLLQFCSLNPRLALEVLITLGLKQDHNPARLEALSALATQFAKGSAINISPKILWRTLLAQIGLCPE